MTFFPYYKWEEIQEKTCILTLDAVLFKTNWVKKSPATSFISYMYRLYQKVFISTMYTVNKVETFLMRSFSKLMVALSVTESMLIHITDNLSLQVFCPRRSFVSQVFCLVGLLSRWSFFLVGLVLVGLVLVGLLSCRSFVLVGLLFLQVLFLQVFCLQDFFPVGLLFLQVFCPVCL